MYWVELRISPVLDRNRDLEFFIAIEPNITALRESELRSKIESLEKINSFMIGREVKMAELKKEIGALKDELANLRSGGPKK